MRSTFDRVGRRAIGFVFFEGRLRAECMFSVDCSCRSVDGCDEWLVDFEGWNRLGGIGYWHSRSDRSENPVFPFDCLFPVFGGTRGLQLVLLMRFE